MLRRSPRQLRSRYEIVTPTLAPTSVYSVALRSLCNQDAMARLPPMPTICPLCQVPGTHFKIYIAYKDELAGWWCILCKGCKRVDVPTQVGPPADLAALIEARIQLEATEEEEKRKQKEENEAIAAVDKFIKQERKTAKARAKKTKAAEREAARAAKARQRDAAHLAFLQKAGQDIESHGKKTSDERKKGVAKKRPIVGKREIQVTLWHKKGEKPLVQNVEVADASRVPVEALAPVAEHLKPGRFVEYWDVDDARWIPGEAPAQVYEGAPSLLVRFTDVKRCKGFGLHVHLLQDGSATTITARKHAIADAKRRLKVAQDRAELTKEAWVLLWAHDNLMPIVDRLALDVKRCVTLTSTFVLKRTFEDLNVDAVHVWNADKTEWEEYHFDEPIPVRGCDTLIVRTPDVETLTYFGVEVLAHHFRSKDQVGLKVQANTGGVAQVPNTMFVAGSSSGLDRATVGIDWVY